jgi:hypothetical protein
MNIDKCNVKWLTHSKSSGESMPLGGYDTGLSVWMEKGQLFFYIDRSGSFDENNQMLKLGRVRLQLNPNPFIQEDCEYCQELKLERGSIEIKGNAPGFPEVKIELWVEVYKPIIHIEVTSSNPVEVEVSYENWRFKERELSNVGRRACFSTVGYPGKVTTKSDNVDFDKEGILFYHRNKNDELIFDKLVDMQGLQEYKDKLWNPQKDFTFGGLLSGEKMIVQGISEGEYADISFKSWKLKSNEKRINQKIDIFLTSLQCETLGDWNKELRKLVNSSKTSYLEARNNALNWWKDFWNRSYISIFPDSNDRENKAWQVGRNYNLFRYMLGCNAYGSYPTKFNGGLFTADPCYTVSEDFRGETPDFRAWGGGSFTAQNQRLVYWPMIKSGDFDMMHSQFQYYLRALGNAELRTKAYWDHEGCSFTEQLENFGLPVGYNWGWFNSGDKFHNRTRWSDPTELLCPWIKYQYANQLEFSYMILKYYVYCNLDISQYLPFIESSVRFYDEHYQYRHFLNTTKRLDAEGHLVIFPSTACETYKDAVNPSDAVAGLKAVLSLLLELPEKYLSGEKREYFEDVAERIPPIAFREMNGKKTIAPAKTWTEILNCEIPQLYPVFPYEVFGVGKEDLQVAIDTWHFGIENVNQRNHTSWHQDNIFCARLGLTEEALEYAVRKLEDGPRRFPAFWGPGHDWVPDHNWGGSGMVGLQDMLLQENGKDILLFPAWPKGWDVEFKLHASNKTVIEGSYKNGKIENLTVDIALCLKK